MAQDVAVLVTEVAAGGELFDLLFHTQAFPELHARLLFGQLLSAVRHCHAQGIPHRDLRPGKLLLTPDFALKVIDFGMVDLIGHNVEIEQGTKQGAALPRVHCGTPAYLAPEARLRPDSFDPVPADVWSLGVLLFVMLSGIQPFAEASLPGDWWYQCVLRQDWDAYWQAMEGSAYFTLEAKSLLQAMLQPNPAERYSLDDVLEHPWMAGPVLSDSVAAGEMSRRAGVVAAAVASARTEAIQQARFSPVAARVPRLAASKATTSSPGHSFPAPPLPEPEPELWAEEQVLFLASTPEQALQRIEKALAKAETSAVGKRVQPDAVWAWARIQGVGVCAQVYQAEAGVVGVWVRQVPLDPAGTPVVGPDPVPGALFEGEGEFLAVFLHLARALQYQGASRTRGRGPPPPPSRQVQHARSSQHQLSQ